MGRAEHRRITGRRSRTQRQSERAGLFLEDLSITAKTRDIYFEGAHALLPLVEKANSEDDLDERIAKWVQQQWSRGATLYSVNAALCGLQHFLPSTRKRLHHSWRLFRTWRKVEVPTRTPPIPELFLYSLANYAISLGDILFAGLLVLGFEGLLRTGELLQVTPADILLRDGETLIHLKHTKTSGRKAATEVVHFCHSWAYVLLEATKEMAITFQGNHVPIWGASHQLFRQKFRRYLKVFCLHRMGFRPCSLRRGGATALFLRTKSYDAALQSGRWESVKAARVYIQEALSRLPLLTLPDDLQSAIQKWYPL